ncbi:GroES-like protein [Dichomitus squalens LYAD-421 SS1]|uniref:GroES-like protein n=1 Tax=Dichomitus squalens (strain LYAD-421) TaxID=732165 RepID=R7T2V5_DICSQ|nr:GroES-like protein [Dichomitus squalens LYAD-421 SS1]EJF62117.1 GroES-like protein [Dichomitus squalens LYAD-421 SS1]
MSTPSHQEALFLEAKQGQWAVRTTELRKPGPGDIVVKVEAAALGGVERKIQAWGILITEYPTILGLDGAGTVVELGEGVTTFVVGDRVTFHGNWDTIAGASYGTFLQYFTGSAQFAVKIPDSISFEAASTVHLGVATAAFSIYNQADSAPSAKYLAPWLPGGRGKYAGKPIVILGGGTSHGQYVTQITGGPVELVYDAVSTAATLPFALALTAPGGNVIVVQFTPEELIAQAQKDGKAVHMVHGVFRTPINHEIGGTLLWKLPELLNSGDIKLGDLLYPNRWEVLPGGLNGIVGGLERMKNDQVSGVKLVVRLQETD